MGQDLDCVERRVNYGDDLLFYRDHRGYVTALPTRWTSLQEENPFLVVSAGRAHFQVGDLIDLAVLITELQSEKNAQGGSGEV